MVMILESCIEIVLTQTLESITTLDMTLSIECDTVNRYDDREFDPHPTPRS